MTKLRRFIPILIGGILGILYVCIINISLKPTPVILYNCDGQEELIIKEYLSYNDEDVISDLGCYHTNINIIEDLHTDDGSKCDGEIEIGKDTITIDIEKGKIEETINHEIGHYIDYKYSTTTLSSEDDFCKIWLKERTFFSGYNSGSSHECFAQSYKHYIENDLEFKEECPGLWNYMDKLLKGVA